MATLKRNRPVTTLGEDALTAGVAVWLTIGLFVDGWAHHNLSELETFFTPWHAVFYSGFLACALWMTWVVRRRVRAGRRGLHAIPYGYGMGLLGVATFALGGLGDMTWHIIFGIEQGLDALFSPTHLLLFLGGTAILSTPFRSAWGKAETDAEAKSPAVVLPAVVSVTLATAFVLFFLYYLWTFEYTFAFRPWAVYAALRGSAMRDLGMGAGIAALLISNALIVTPTLMLLRRFKLPPGSVTFMLSAMQLFMAAMLGPGDAQAFGAYRGLAVLAAGGVAADLMIVWMKPYRERIVAFRGFAAAFPAVLWLIYFVLGDRWHGIAWSLEMWTGMIVWNVLSGYMIAVLMTFGGLDVKPAPNETG